jgi:EAL domain-containing protein (putative c-di-GMP-specific phosphodiesterase class I)
MTESTLLEWSAKLACIDNAFQPIVNIHTGVCYGYEALIRNVEGAGFETINAFFDNAFECNVLHPIDLLLRQKAMKKMPLLTVSSVVLELPADVHRISSPEEVGNVIASLKKAAKQSPERFKYATIQDFNRLARTTGEKAGHIRLVS